ncbi:MAG: hypothetical protein JO047_10080 [Alphaproteobacteria bacterium]|nr:hypothetical protein [Alphaproteobacteria bacterium]
MPPLFKLLVAALMLLAGSVAAEARITRIEIARTEPAFGGARFGDAGDFVLLTGTAFGELDPADPRNAIIQDIALAPRNGRGLVEYSMDVAILKPAEAARGNGTLLYDVVNRGHRVALTMFNLDASGDNPGDGFLQRHGFTIVWSGWQGDLLPGLIRLNAPVARAPDGSAITGRVRKEFELFAPASTLGLGDTDLGRGLPYPSVSTDNTGDLLTIQVRQGDPPVPVPNADWSLADCRETPFPGVPSTAHVCLKGGFDTDHIYQLVYTAKDPRVLGIGLAATRDLVAFLHYAERDDAGHANPLAGTLRWTLAHGTSQSGRYLRSFLHLGFNQDEAGRRVFDGMNVHVASARNGLNERFGQPGTDSLQHEDHLAPMQDAPFTWGVRHDPIADVSDGILARCQTTSTCPQVIQTVSSNEYWNQRMALDTTDGADADVPLPPNVHLYLFASTQHAPGLSDRLCEHPGNPNRYTFGLRALLLHLQALVANGTAPPPSRYPTIAGGTLVLPDRASAGFPDIPGFAWPGLVNNLPLEYRGPRFDPDLESGIMQEPPVAQGTPRYVVRVPKVDGGGNEIGGIRSVTLQAPLGTYTGWNLRKAGYAEGELCYLVGSFVPFARTRAEREAAHDPRPSLEERYGSAQGYAAAVEKAVAEEISAGFLLAEDAQRLLAQARAGEGPK